MVESLGSWWRSLTHRNDDDEHDADDDTLDDATNALLSMLPLASIVVDEHDEVIRAHPSAYSLGVVRDDVIIEDSVLQAVREVRSFGGKKQFDLTTTTGVCCATYAESRQAFHSPSRETGADWATASQ